MLLFLFFCAIIPIYLDSKISCWGGSSASILANTKTLPTVSSLERVAFNFKSEQKHGTNQQSEDVEFRNMFSLVHVAMLESTVALKGNITLCY